MYIYIHTYVGEHDYFRIKNEKEMQYILLENRLLISSC